MGISSRLLNEGEAVVLHTRTHAKALLDAGDGAQLGEGV